MDPKSTPLYNHEILPGDFEINNRMFEFTKYDTASYAWVYHMGTETGNGDYYWNHSDNPDHPAPTVAIDLHYQHPEMWVLEARATAGPDHPKEFTVLAPDLSKLYSHERNEFETAAEHVTTLAAQIVNTALPISPDPEIHRNSPPEPSH